VVDLSSRDLAWLVYPRSVSEFLADYWERGPLLLQHRGECYYRDLLTSEDLDNIISSPSARYPAIRLAKGGWFYPPDAYTKDIQVGFLKFHGVPDVDKISAEYAKGATITLPALHRTWEPLLRLCARLEGQLDHSVHGNAYVTPGRAVGFPPHYDTHDIFVLQIAGCKHWRIDKPTIELPHDSQPCIPQNYIPGPRLAEIEMGPGDLLYLPRGYAHSTTTGKLHSAHITIGINIYSWVDLLGKAFPSSFERTDLRRGLPVGFASRAELRPTIKEQLARLIPAPPSGLEGDRLLDELIGRIQPGRLRVPERFRTAAIVISADSLLSAPRKQRYEIKTDSLGVTLLFEGRSYIFPSGAGSVLQAMCERPAFRAQELVEAPGIDPLLGFVRYLQGIGFLRSAD
jgi:hypothetical protein